LKLSKQVNNACKAHAPANHSLHHLAVGTPTKEDKSHGHANAHVFSPTNPELFYSQPFPAVASDWGDHD